MMIDGGWRDNPDGGMTRVTYPHGIHGGACVETTLPQRVYYLDECPKCGRSVAPCDCGYDPQTAAPATVPPVHCDDWHVDVGDTCPKCGEGILDGAWECLHTVRCTVCGWTCES